MDRTRSMFPLRVNYVVVIIALFIISDVNTAGNIPETSSDEPLYLTPYLKSGNVSKAREMSVVNNLPNTPEVLSYSGFFTVNEKYNSNIFFWFVPAMDGNKNAPVVLWMQGGPGLTGLFGFFVEHGPYVIYSNMSAGLRENAWTSTFNVIYVDNPVGTGFSFTDDPKGYVQTEMEMAKDMYEFLRQFFILFNEYKKNDFYIAGESYGGKYAAYLAYKMHIFGNAAKINLKGVAIGNCEFCDPETMMDYGDYLYQIGLLDRKQARFVKMASKSIVKLIQQKKYYKALVELDKLMPYEVLPYDSYFENVTDYSFFCNFLLSRRPADYEYYKPYLANPEVRKAIHVGNLTFQNGMMARKNLLLDIMQSVKLPVQDIMDNYRVLFYSGQLDLLVPYPTTINFLNSVEWKYNKEFKNADRQIWKLEGSNAVVGYYHNVKDFYEVLVRDAGHIVPYDQPKLAYELISRFLNKKSFSG